MKKQICALLALAMLLCFLPQAASAAEETDVYYEIEAVRCQRVSYGLLLNIENIETLLPDWLLEKLGFATASESPTNAAPGSPDTPDAASQQPEDATKPAQKPSKDSGKSFYAYSPSLYTPYSVTKTKTYYDKKGAAAYKLMLTAVFIDTETDSYCLQTELSYQVYSGSWEITPGAVQKNGGTATAAFTVSQLFTLVPIKTETVTLTVNASERTGVSYTYGDLNVDGKLTAADARLALRAAVNMESLSALQKTLGDMNSDGKITAADARLILRAVVKLD